MTRINILIADVCKFDAWCLERHIKQEKEVDPRVVNAFDALHDNISNRQTDILIVEPAGASLAVGLVAEIRNDFPDLPILVFTGLPQSLEINFFHVKANGFLSKTADCPKILQAVLAVLRNGYYFSNELIQRIERGIAGHAGPLSEREQEILALIGTGMPSREISNKLGLATKTIESHRSRIQAKLNLSGNGELERYALNARM